MGITSPNDLESHRPANGICTDGAHSCKKGITQYRGIDLETGEELFYRELGNQTVNIGEFLGLMAAVKFIIESDSDTRIIYTDSMTAISWFRNKATASQKRNSDLMRAEIYLKVMASRVNSIEVRHWDTTKWGENPADFGNK